MGRRGGLRGTKTFWDLSEKEDRAHRNARDSAGPVWGGAFIALMAHVTGGGGVSGQGPEFYLKTVEKEAQAHPEQAAVRKE